MSCGACHRTSCVVGEEPLGIGEDVTMPVPKIRRNRQDSRHKWSKRSKLYLKFIRKGKILGINDAKKQAVPKSQKIGGVLSCNAPPKLLSRFLISQFNSSLHQIRKFLLLLH